MTKRLLSWLLVLALLVGICVTALADASPEPDGGGGGTPCNHVYGISLSPERVKYTSRDSSYHYKTVIKVMKCVYCASVTEVVIESPKLELHSWVILSRELVGDRYLVRKSCRYCNKTLQGYED